MDLDLGVLRLMDPFLSHGGPQDPTGRSRPHPNDAQVRATSSLADEVLYVPGFLKNDKQPRRGINVSITPELHAA